MLNLEEFTRFQDYYLIDLIDIYSDLNNYCKNNAFDILNSDNKNKHNEFIDLIFKNVHTPHDNIIDDDESDNDDFILY